MSKRFLPFLLLAPLLMGNESCNNSETKDRAKVQNQQGHYADVQPFPFYDYSLERDAAIQIYNARNEEVATHTIWRSNSGVIEFDCPSIGFPLPYDTSLTNPLQRAYNGGGSVIEQAEPNGLFSSKNSNSTWVLCVVDGGLAPVYVETFVTTWPFPMVVDYETNRAVPASNARSSVIVKYDPDKTAKAAKAPKAPKAKAKAAEK